MNKLIERKQNLRAIIELLRMNGAMPQNQLKERCGLQASTVSYLINDLKNDHLVLDLGKVESQGKVGKPACMVGLNNDAAQFLGIYVEDDCLQAYVIGIGGQIIQSINAEYAPQDMERSLFSFISRSLQATPQIQGIGIAIKAVVYNDGKILSGIRRVGDNILKRWELENLPQALRSAFPGVPIIVENDANCTAELHHYVQKSDNFALYLLNDIPFGIGIGLMIHGQVYRGAQGAAGEFFLKDLRRTDIQNSSGKKKDAVRSIVTAILPHMLQTAYLLDPDHFVLTGSLFKDISTPNLEEATSLVSVMPMPVIIDSGRDQVLNPAHGAAHLAVNCFLNNYLEEKTKR